MSQPLPHFATISYAFRRRFTAEVIEGVFRWVLEEVACAGYLSPEVVFVDGTHMAARLERVLEKQLGRKPSANLIRAKVEGNRESSDKGQSMKTGGVAFWISQEVALPQICIGGN